MKTMKATMQSSYSIWKQVTRTLAISVAVTGFSLTTSGGTPAPVAMCAKFVGPTPTSLIKNDSNVAQKYCDSEIDVLAASTGGFGFTTNDRKGPRKVWIDLKNAVQFNSPIVPSTALPASEMEFGFSLNGHSNPDGTNADGSGGCLPPVTELLGMAAGQWFYANTSMGFTDTTSTASKGEYRLRFGQPICEPNFSWNMYSDCPLKVTAGFDFNGNGIIDDSPEYSEANLDLSVDGSVDIWTIEPAYPDAHAILLKVNKRQQFDVVGSFSVPFKLVFTKQQFGSVL